MSFLSHEIGKTNTFAIIVFEIMTIIQTDYYVLRNKL